MDVFTVRPALYDIKKYEELALDYPDESEYFENLTKRKKQFLEKDFQREKDQARVNKIQSYISENEHAFFPNTIICTCDLANENLDLTYEEYLKKNDSLLSFFDQNGDQDICKLTIPVRQGALLVIDGQHRLEGLKEYFKKDQNDDYEILLSFIIGFDRSIIAQQFYTINHEQKSVNKSILYHLMGEFSDDIDELTLIHNYIRVLNELEKSPFFKRIKMLGKTPKESNQEEKRMYSISQAFLVDELIKLVSIKSINSLYQPIFLCYYLDSDKQVQIVKFLIKFFKAVQNIRPDWDNPETSILSKGLGVAALIKTIQFIFPIILIDEWDYNSDKISELKTIDIQNYLKGLENVDLKEYSRTAGAATIGKIKESIIEKIEYLGCNSYNEFELNFKENYLEKFKSWNKNNIK